MSYTKRSTRRSPRLAPGRPTRPPAALAILAAAYVFTSASRVFPFWAAFILTRPLGATLGDLFDKPVAQGGFEFGRFTATAILAAAMVALILVIPRRPGAHPGGASAAPAE